MAVPDQGSETHSPECEFPPLPPWEAAARKPRSLARQRLSGWEPHLMALGSRQRLGKARLGPGSCVCKTGVCVGPHLSPWCRSREVALCGTRQPLRAPRPVPAAAAPDTRSGGGCFSVNPKLFQSIWWNQEREGKREREGKSGITPLRLRVIRPGLNLGWIWGHPW